MTVRVGDMVHYVPLRLEEAALTKCDEFDEAKPPHWAAVVTSVAPRSVVSLSVFVPGAEQGFRIDVPRDHDGGRGTWHERDGLFVRGCR